MPDPLIISLGGIPISLIPDQALGGYDSVKRAVDFFVSELPEVTIRVHCGWFPDLPSEEVVFDTNLGWRYLHLDGKRILRVRTAFQDPYLVGVFPHDFRSGDIYIASSRDNPGQYVFPFSYPLGELYIMNLLGAGLGMLFHAAGVIDQGKAYLFVGQSDAGKSTTARLWQEQEGVEVVNDDKVIIRKKDGGFHLFGTPWHGEGGIASPDSAPLKRIFILKQASYNNATPLSPAQAAVELLTRAFLPLWEADMISGSLKFLDELCQSISCHELGFLPDASAVDLVRNLS